MMRPCRASSSATTDRTAPSVRSIARSWSARPACAHRGRERGEHAARSRRAAVLRDARRHLAAEGRPLSPPPEIVAHLEEAHEILAAAGVDSELTSAAVSRATRSSRWRGVPAKTIVLGERHHGFFAKLFGGDVAAGVQREARLHRDPRPSG